MSTLQKRLKVKKVKENLTVLKHVTAEIPVSEQQESTLSPVEETLLPQGEEEIAPREEEVIVPREEGAIVPHEEQSILPRRKKSRFRIIAIAAGLILLTSGLAAAYWMSRTGRIKDLSEFTVSVDSEVLTLRISASGKIVPFQSVNLSPKNAGILEKLLVEQGDRVEKGQLLAKMDATDLEGRIIQAQAALKQAQARLGELKAGNRKEEIMQAQARAARANVELEQIKANRPQQIKEAENQVLDAIAQVKLTKTRFDSMTSLVEKGAEARDRLDEAERNYRSAVYRVQEARNRLEQVKISTAGEVEQRQAALAEANQALKLANAGTRPEVIVQAEAEVQRASGELVTLNNLLSDTNIRAPFDGIVTQKYATEGAFVTPTTSASSTSSATSTSIVALARGLEIIADVPEVDIGQIKENQVVDIKADAFPDQIFKGRVRLIAPEAIVEQNVTSFQVRVQVQTGQDKLRSGMNTDLIFLGETVRDALVVPTVAIATQKGKTGVYVPDEDNEPEFMPVTIGSTIQDKTQILDGLNRDDKVFVDFPEGLEPKDSEE